MSQYKDKPDLEDLPEISKLDHELQQLKRCLEQVNEPTTQHATISLYLTKSDKAKSCSIGFPASANDIRGLLEKLIDNRKTSLKMLGVNTD